MFDIPESWRHRIAELMCRDRNESITRVHRLGELCDETPMLPFGRLNCAGKAQRFVATLRMQVASSVWSSTITCSPDGEVSSQV